MKRSSSVVEIHRPAEHSSMEEGSISVNAKHSSVDVHEMISKFNNTEQEQRCMNKIDDKKKSLFIKVSIYTMSNN